MDIKTITTVATFITSLVSLGTLWNVTRQRITSNRPDLYIKENYFTVLINQKNLHTNWYDIEGNENYALYLFNIGLGSAKNVKITWELDEENIINLKKLDINNLYHLEYSPIEFVSLTYGAGNAQQGLLTKNDLYQTLDFVLPYKPSDDNLDSIEIPSSVRILFVIYIEQLVNQGKLNDLPTFINHNIKLAYTDINNKKYSKRYKVRLNMLRIHDNELRLSVTINNK